MFAISPPAAGSTYSRRWFLKSAAAVAGATAALRTGLSGLAAAAGRGSLTGSKAIRAMTHVHGPWSEGEASWDAQLRQATLNAIDVLYMTDHDCRAMALGYITSLSGAPWVISSAGTLEQKAATASGGSISLLAESASSTAPASVTMELQPKPFCFNKLRTSIAGTTITQKITGAVLTNGARYEVVVPLSYHTAIGGRPAGQYRLIYRFGGATGRWTEGNGLTGVVGAGVPAAGSVQTLKPASDVAAIWPDLVANDNSLYGLSFVARSPKVTAVADIRVASVTFARTQASAASVITNQAAIPPAYKSRYPAVKLVPQAEISKSLPDMNTFGMPEWLPSYGALSTNSDTAHRQIVDQVHKLGGIVCYDHPLGYEDGPLLSPAEATAKRRQVFTWMHARGVFGCDTIEIGYTIRGQVDTATHIALFDTFSRNGTWLTGNGGNDDHAGTNWNGFYTGVWASARSDAAVAAALRAGRAFAAHLRLYPKAEIDLLVDGTVPMGHIAVSTKTTRRLAIYAAGLPAGSTVQLVRGPVDYAGKVDPATVVARTFPASAFVNGLLSVGIDTSSDRFFRVQVVNSAGTIIGIGNPVWLLRRVPPSGIPAPRRSA